jgi:hypothetical protein
MKLCLLGESLVTIHWVGMDQNKFAKQFYSGLTSIKFHQNLLSSFVDETQNRNIVNFTSPGPRSNNISYNEQRSQLIS